MDKGWGLSIDTLFMDKPAAIGLSLTPLTAFKRMSPANLNYSDQSSHHQPQAAGTENRAVVGEEVDFFSDNDKGTLSSTNYSHSNAASAMAAVKKEDHQIETADFDVNTGLNLLTTITGSDESTVDGGSSLQVKEERAKQELTLLEAELERMNTENQRLRGMLSQVTSNCSALQMHLVNFMDRQQSSSPHNQENFDERTEEKKRGLEIEPRQFMDLGLGGRGGVDLTEELSRSSSEERTVSESPAKEKINRDSSEGVSSRKREESSECVGWIPNKLPKSSAQKTAATSVPPPAEATMRKARVSVRARSEAPMISDGCQWRKYGQKLAKGNPCPRAYYRCTMAVGCPVRKQVQRCVEERTILITTYEGSHNHPLPPAAMAMASTTSAAVDMLLSGSMSSADGVMNPNLLARKILPSSSTMATLSASAPFPTVTLDLTNASNPFQFQRPDPTRFDTPNSTPLLNPSLHQVFGQSQSKFSGIQLSPPGMDPTHRSSSMHHQPSFPDSLSAATAAITTNPNFTAALAAAISSIIGGAKQV